MIRQAVFLQAPLVPSDFAPLPLGAIRPEGWLKDELAHAAATITGRLDEVWPQVGADSGWLGGDGEDGERTPYWLDGLVSLAYVMRAPALIAKAKRYIDAIIDGQTEEGQIGPERTADWWPRAVALKAMWSYYTASGSRRALLCMLRFAKYMLTHIDDTPPVDWARARALEFYAVLMPMYSLTGRRYLLRLMERLLDHTLDWTGNFAAFRFPRAVSQILPWEDLKQRRGSDEYHATHVVNNAMALKYPAFHHALIGNIKAAAYDMPWERLMRYHGQAYGLFSGDEHLAGRNPSAGVETCAVVEAMYSLECLAALTGDPAMGDRLERIAFSALPASFTPDGWGHQYLQQANQIAAARDEHGWYNNKEDANTFGLEPNYGCCTANLHQGWPKYAASLWMAHRDGGVAALSYAPCQVRWTVNGVAVSLRVQSDYPRDGAVSIEIRPEVPVRFTLRLRIPAWAEDSRLLACDEPYEAREGTYAVIDRTWHSGDRVALTLPMAPRIETGYHQGISVLYGPLLMALPIAERWSKIADHGPCADYEVRADGAWAYALLPGEGLSAEISPGMMTRWKGGDPLVRVRARCAPFSWPRKGGDAASPPVLPWVTVSAARWVDLVPYGGTSLRIAHFPAGRWASDGKGDPDG